MMESILLAVSVAAMMVFGYYLMKRIDAFIDDNRAAISKNTQHEDEETAERNAS